MGNTHQKPNPTTVRVPTQGVRVLSVAQASPNNNSGEICEVPPNAIGSIIARVGQALAAALLRSIEKSNFRTLFDIGGRQESSSVEKIRALEKSLAEKSKALDEEQSQRKELAKENKALLECVRCADETALSLTDRAAGTIIKLDAVLTKITLIVKVDQPFKSISAYTTNQDGVALWYWEEDKARLNHHSASKVLKGTNFVRFSDDISRILEEKYQHFKETPADSLAPTISLTSTKIHNPHTGSKYTIDFEELLQINVNSGYKRKIRREQPPDQIASEKLPDIPEDLRGPQSEMGEFELLPVSAGQLVQSISLHKCGEWFLGHVIEPKSNSPGSVTSNTSGPPSFSSKKKKLLITDKDGNPIDLPSPGTMALTDTPRQPMLGWIPLCITDPQGNHKIQTCMPNCQTPATWSLDKGVMCVNLPKSSQEYHGVSSFFFGSWGRSNADITSIKRIQNLPLWKCYNAKKQSLQLQVDQGFHNMVNNTGNIEHSRLFHGTSEECANKIIHQGFNRAYSFAKCGSYGKGTYFARDSSLSASYAKRSSSCDGHIFVCRVLVGDWCKGKSGMRVPPSKPHNPMELFDTTVDNVGNPSQYVIFHDSQAYPEYLVTFKN